MAAEDEKKDYVTLYSYFYTRKRIGVIGNCHSGVKDMYIVPIASHDPIPPELKPFDGPGRPSFTVFIYQKIYLHVLIIKS